MFQNLIESTTHHTENKRRVTFLAGTLGIYSLLLVAGGVASVYAYDAHLENQNLEFVSLVAPVPVPDKQPDLPKPREIATSKASETPQVATVTEHTTMMPKESAKEIKAVAANVPPPDIHAQLGRVNSIPTTRSVTFDDNTKDGPTDNSTNSTALPPPPPVKVEKTVPPPVPVKVEKPVPPPVRTTPVSLGVINGRAASLPKPVYSSLAKAAGAAGVVSVQVLIDETGRVVSARAVSGHPLLQPEAVRAALQARFTPTFLSQQPVKVTGVINYNFTR